MTPSYDIIFKRRHPSLYEKEKIWRLVYNSYIGGSVFSNGDYLIRYPKESYKSFNARKNRAVYFNQVSPVVDLLSGLLFLNEPTRTIPQKLSFLSDNISGNKKVGEFMRLVSAYSFMFTIGILIDFPNIDQSKKERLSEKERKDNKINPYATIYLPFDIVDFSININDGELDWVILDNSYYNNSDPLSEAKTVYKRTLWKRNSFVSFVKDGLNGAIRMEDEIEHDLGIVPFRFVSWRDDNSDFVGETLCEDIASISKLIYNNMSYMDEMLAAGTFKMLAYPSEDGNIPSELKSGGVGALSVIPYNMASSTAPSFIGHSLSEIDPFIKAIEFYMAEILKKVGLSTDETKEFVKSGVAKRIDFQKMRALLISGAQMMGKLEEWIFETANKWINKSTKLSEGTVKIEYQASFDDDDLVTKISLLSDLLTYPVKKLRIESLSIIVKKLLGNETKHDKLEEILKEIESTYSKEAVKSVLANTKTNTIDDTNSNKTEDQGAA